MGWPPYGHYSSAKEMRQFMVQASEWRMLAKQAAEEKNPERLIEIVGALICAIDEQEMQKTHTRRPASSKCKFSMP